MSQTTVLDAMTRMNGHGVALFAASAMALVTSQLTQLGTSTTQGEEANAQTRITETALAYGYSTSSRDKPYAYSNGVAIIPVHGMLLNRFSYGWGFVTGYQFIRGLANLAADDEDVDLIVYDINSYGGEAAGCFELCKDLAEISVRKPTLAMVDSAACSAAYAVASSQRKIVASPSSTVGSIGVISMHMDMSGYLDKAGIVVTLIAEGPQKTAGNPYEPLSEEALSDIKERVTQRMTLFVDQVVTARGSKGLDEAAIRATESRWYLAQQALDLKMIDAVQTPSEAVSSFLAELGDDIPSSGPDPEDEEMAVKSEADQAAEVASARQTGVKEGATAERTRVTSIMGLPEAATRPTLAAKLAAKENMSVDDAKDLLSAAVEEPAKAAPAGQQQNAAEQGAGALDRAMDNTGGGAGVAPNSGSGDEQSNKPSRASAALATAFGPAKRK